MTEREWLTSTSAQRMLQYLLPHSPDRKLRLFAAACYHRIMPLLADRTRCDRARTSVAFMRRAQRAVRVAERFAEGEVDDAERVAARETIREGTGAAALDRLRGSRRSLSSRRCRQLIHSHGRLGGG